MFYAHILGTRERPRRHVPDAHDDEPDADPAGFAGGRPTPRVGDGNRAERGRDVVRAGDQASLSRGQTEPTLQRRDAHVDQTVYDKTCRRRADLGVETDDGECKNWLC